MSHSEHTIDGCAAPAAGAAEYDLVEIAAAMRSMSQRVAGDGGGRAPLDALVRVAVAQVPGARWVSVSVLRNGRFTTAAATAQEAVRADLLQYDIGSGPCVDAVLKESLFVTGEVRTDPRWSRWGRRAHTEVGVNSVLSQRLRLQDQAGVIAGLNIYSDQPDAFDRAAVGVGLILATHGALAVSEQLASEQAGHLSHALQSNREIGVAMGILMNKHRFTRQEAFDVLRVASQNSNRKLADIAVEVADTGTLTIDQMSRDRQLPIGTLSDVRS
jgi:hypothetical protein